MQPGRSQAAELWIEAAKVETEFLCTVHDAFSVVCAPWAYMEANLAKECPTMSWVERIGQVAQAREHGGASRLETFVVWTGAVLLLLILMLNATLD